MKLIVFDVDGTLVDSQHLIVAAQRTAFAAPGLPAPSREQSLSVVGLSLVQAFTALVWPAGPVEGLAESYRQAFQRLRADPAYHEPLFPGADALLAELAGRDDVRLGIATGKSRRGVAHLIERNRWEGLFATIQTADDAPSKPHPAMLHQAMAETGVGPPDSVMVGDSTFDMAMAHAAGMAAIGVSWGYHAPRALEAAGAEVIVDSYPALRRHLVERVLGSQDGSADPISGR